MEKKVELSKLMKKGKGLLISGIIVLLMGVISFTASYLGYKDEVDNPNMFDAFLQDNYGYIEVEYILDYFAEEETTKDKVYIVFNPENKMYLASIDDKTMESLKELLDYTYSDDEREHPGTVKIKGTSAQISDSLKELAINYYNESYGDTYLNKSNFSTYAGNYYLDTKIDPMSENMPFMYIVMGIFVIIGGCLIIGYFNNRKSTKKCLAKYEGKLDKIEDELNSSSVSDYSKYKLYITNKYIVSYVSGLQIIEYKDIVWLYPMDRTYRGNTTRTIFVITEDSKTHTVCAINVSKKTKIILDEIYESILTKLPEKALAGYTNENRLKVKELYKK